MKLHKKAVACLLAAAMAIFMMTACGNDSAPAIVNGVTYRNNVAPVASVDSDSIKEQGTITAENSRYIAFQEKRKTEKTWYIAGTIAQYEGTALISAPQRITAKTERYFYLWEEGDEPSFLEEKDGGIYGYEFIEDGGSKYALRSFWAQGEFGIKVPTGTLTSATVTVNGETYYAEIVRDGADEDIACFRPDQPVPTYVFKKENGKTSTEVYNEVVVGSDKGTCAQVLADYNVYMYDDNWNLVDKDGNTYVVNWNSYTVTKDGVDVTQDFQWLRKSQH